MRTKPKHQRWCTTNHPQPNFFSNWQTNASLAVKEWNWTQMSLELWESGRERRQSLLNNAFYTLWTWVNWLKYDWIQIFLFKKAFKNTVEINDMCFLIHVFLFIFQIGWICACERGRLRARRRASEIPNKIIYNNSKNWSSNNVTELNALCIGNILNLVETFEE